MSPPTYRAILLFGAPGVGKGTQGQRIGQLPHYRHLSTGDLFRSLDRESPLGKEVRSYSERGVLVPDELTIRIFQDAIARLVASKQFDPARDTLALDGIPRNVHQAQSLDGQLQVVRIIYLVSSDEQVMIGRMLFAIIADNRTETRLVRFPWLVPVSYGGALVGVLTTYYVAHAALFGTSIT